MKYLLLIVLSLFFYNFNVYAAKPQSPGKSNKQESVQHDAKADHTDSDAVKSKEKQNKDKKEKAAKPSDEDDREDKAADEDRAKNAKDKGKGSDKTDSERKEADKGSETGQQKRAEHSRKWWKFWGEKE